MRCEGSTTMTTDFADGSARALWVGALALLATATTACKDRDGGADDTGTPVVEGCDTEPGCLLVDGDPAGLLSVQAPASDDVWVVGASPDGEASAGPVLVQYDGTAWTSVDTSEWAGTELWWTWVSSEEVVAVGSEGLVLELDRASGALSRVEGPGAGVTFFGVWGASAEELWAVGQDDSGEDTAPVLWRRTGGEWADAGSLLPELSGSQTLFKVHGQAADDLWVVGSRGLAMRWDGVAFEVSDTSADSDTTNAPILTVDASAPNVTAVGGAGNGLVLELVDGTWRDRSPDFNPGFNGVCSGTGQTWAVGMQGSRALREADGTWVRDLDRGVDNVTFDDWHGCAVDPAGGLWIVGGSIAARPLTDGVLAYQGPDEPPAW